MNGDIIARMPFEARFASRKVSAFLFSSIGWWILQGATANAQSETQTENWPQYRGAKSDGLATGTTLPENWSATENVVWKKTFPDSVGRRQLVGGDRIFVTSAVGEKELPTPHVGGYPGGHLQDKGIHRWMLYCLNFKSGEITWQTEVHKGLPKEKRHPRNSYATETPVTDGERVYAYFANQGLFCYAVTGEKLWEHRYDAYPMRDGWNTGSSPVHKDPWLIFRTAQLDDHDRLWIKKIERKKDHITIVLNHAVWQGDYAKNFTWYGIFAVNPGTLPPGKYQAKWIVKPFGFLQFEDPGNRRTSWPKDEQAIEGKDISVATSFTVATGKEK